MTAAKDIRIQSKGKEVNKVRFMAKVWQCICDIQQECYGLVSTRAAAVWRKLGSICVVIGNGHFINATGRIVRLFPTFTGISSCRSWTVNVRITSANTGVWLSHQ